MSDKLDMTALSVAFVSKPDESLPPEIAAVDLAMSRQYDEKAGHLRSILVLAENPIDLNDENQKRIIFARLSYGLRKAGEMLGWVRFHYKQAKSDCKRAAAVAALEEYTDYLVSKRQSDDKLKATEKMREFYVGMSETVRAANSREAMLEAMEIQASTMKLEFMMSISTLKAMAYGMRDSDFMSGSAANAGDAQ